MNLVNGWMYTGMGPYYLKNSSKAQNIMATGVGSMFAGRGVADVLNEVSDLAQIGAGEKGEGERGRAIDSDKVSKEFEELRLALQSQSRTPKEMLNYAEIYIYEPHLNPDGSTRWEMVARHNFNRHYFQPSMDEGTKQVVQSLLENRLKLRQEETKRIAAETEKIKAQDEKGKNERLPAPKKDDGTPERGRNPNLPGNSVPNRNTNTSSSQPNSPNSAPNNNVNIRINESGTVAEPARAKKKRFTFPKLGFGRKSQVETKTTRKVEDLSVVPVATTPGSPSPGSSVGN